jgi:imidazolonepropionase-like amidohydrolase
MLRSEVFSALEILRQAASVTAEMMMLQGQIGCVVPGACADLIVVDGDPLKDISLLTGDGHRLRAIVRGGTVVKNPLE